MLENGVYVSGAPSQSTVGQNGQARPRGPQIPKKIEWISLPEEYGTDPPMQVRIWVTYPRKYIDEIRSGDPARLKEGMRKIVLEHNGWIDEEGEPMPPADSIDPDFWDVCPDVIAAAVLALITVEAGKGAASVMRTRRR